jgi:serine/threonine protein kinase/Skp family chaperone for outer membrane proteins
MRIGSYEVVSTLGQGGMGLVYAARSPDGRDVAVKVLRKNEGEVLARFERERRLLASFGEADGFVPLLDAGTTPQGPYLVMPLVAGGTLRKKLEAGPLGIEETVELARSLAAALGTGHARGIVHRDMKPENILFTATGTPLIADLGLAKHFDVRAPGANQSVVLSRVGALRGTAGYMAREQMADATSVGPTADVFSLGAILYECLAGEPPFLGESFVEVLAKVSEGKFEALRGRRPDVPEWLAALVERALAPAASDRFPDGLALGDALGARGVVAVPAARRTRAADSRRLAQAEAQPARAKGETPAPAHPSTASTLPPPAPKAPLGEDSLLSKPPLSKAVLGAALGLAVVGFCLVFAFSSRSTPGEPAADAVALANAERAKQEAEDRDRKSRGELEALRKRVADEAEERRQRDLAAEKAAVEKEAADKAAAEKAAAEKAAADKAAEKAAADKAAEKAAADKAAADQAAADKAAEKAAADKAAADKAAEEKAAADKAAQDKAAADKAAADKIALRALADSSRDRIVEAIKLHQSSRVAAVRDDVKRGESFPERDDLVKAADTAAKLLAKIEDVVRRIPTDKRPDMKALDPTVFFAALIESVRRSSSGADQVKQAAMLVGAVDKLGAPEELFVSDTGNDTSAVVVRQLLTQLRLEYPKKLPKRAAPLPGDGPPGGRSP